MSLLSRLGLVHSEEEILEEEVQETAEEQKEQKTTAPQAQGSSQRFAMTPPPTASAPGQIVGRIDNDVYDKLSAAIEANDLEGNDFLEFMQSLNASAGLTVDEKSKFQMVFGTLSTASGGLTKETLISSIQHYKNVVANEKEIFSGEMLKATEGMVTANLQEAERQSQLAVQKAEEITRLQEEIQTLNENVATLKAEAQESEQKIAQKEADFEVTVGQLVGQLDAYESKINQYIQ